MRLTVTFPDGALVADVVVEPDCPFAREPGEPPGFVVGNFAAGPAFPRVRDMLDVFNSVFASGDLVRASELHEQMDRLGLIATGLDGQVFQVSVVYFQAGGLLFAATTGRTD